MNTNKSQIFKIIAVALLVIAFLVTGCIGEDDEKSNSTAAVLNGIEIDAYAIYHPVSNTNTQEYTEVSVPVWNQGYSSPVTDAVVKINGTELSYNSTFETYSASFSNILPGDNIEFSITVNNETYTKTLVMPGKIEFNQPAAGAIFDYTIANTITWAYINGDDPDKVTLFVGYLPEKYETDIDGINFSYVIPANTFEGTEAYAYVGARAINYYDDPDGRKSFEVFTSDEYFANY